MAHTLWRRGKTYETLVTRNPDVLEDKILLKMISWVVVVFLSFVSSENHFTFETSHSYQNKNQMKVKCVISILVSLVLNVNSYFMPTIIITDLMPIVSFWLETVLQLIYFMLLTTTLAASLKDRPRLQDSFIV